MDCRDAKTTRRIRGTTPIVEAAARLLCEEMTPAEQTLWEAIRGKRLECLKFRSQHPVGRFILDFYCPRFKLAIEVDGEIHNQQSEQDTSRTEQLEAFGYTVLRFSNEAIFTDLPAVLDQIRAVTIKRFSDPAEDGFLQAPPESGAGGPRINQIVCALFLFLILSGIPSWATHEIVYSARYYYPLKNKAISRFHLYLIHPDGSGKTQITRGKADDYEPQWSPNGQHILFYRAQGEAASYCVYDLRTRRMRTLWKLPGKPDHYDGKWKPNSQSVLVQRDGDVWQIDTVSGTRRTLPYKGQVDCSPDGRKWYVNPSDEKDYLALSPASRRPVRDRIYGFAWLNNETVAGVEPEFDHPPVLRFIGLDGREKRRMVFQDLRADPPVDRDLSGWFVDRVVPDAPRSLICRQNIGHNVSGTRRVWGWNRLDLATGKMNLLLEGMSLSWEPGGKRFVAVPSTALGDYGRRQVYIASLQVVSWPQKKTRTLVDGTVWVWSADWRPVTKSQRYSSR